MPWWLCRARLLVFLSWAMRSITSSSMVTGYSMELTNSAHHIREAFIFLGPRTGSLLTVLRSGTLTARTASTLMNTRTTSHFLTAKYTTGLSGSPLLVALAILCILWEMITSWKIVIFTIFHATEFTTTIRLRIPLLAEISTATTTSMMEQQIRRITLRLRCFSAAAILTRDRKSTRLNSSHMSISY